ncbi:L,D-transpeptidase family protein [Hymenobacter sp. DH14]|uniref:L,D-transpeptidase family protein n=1 Tax=Hymenobacter cyanobacteriorum TaxID=2926463 RepID=A0A9X1VIB2_9BACT|nr:L,D-transpeptidase family protein [Hymenobacter cyanobacteriorum]MCI1186911.1 L,D-transpeptidase family protein [Hymenobacter cyanobacteriorum]
MLSRCLRRNLLASCLGLSLGVVTGCRTVGGPAQPKPRAAELPAVVQPPKVTLPPKRLPLPTVALLIRAWLDTLRPMPPGSQRAAPVVRAFYQQPGGPAWTAAPPADTLGRPAHDALALLARAYAYGLQPADYGLPALLALRDSLAAPALPAGPVGPRPAQLARFDVCLTTAVLAFAHDLQHGRRHRARQPAEAAAWLRAALAAGEWPAALLAVQPASREYRQLQQALAQWLAQPPGPPDSVVARHRSRFERVALNLERWRAEPIEEAEYLLVNIPAFELLVLGHDTVLRRARVIVGKPATPTPTLRSRIRYFTLAPVWNVPYSIASQEMLPRLQDDPSFLAESNLAVYDGRGRRRNPWRIDWGEVTEQNFKYTVQQEAGPRNVLGNFVFHFPNPYLVYLHDTPERQLFARPDRALSHGCIRVERPRELAAWLLRREGNPTPLLTPAQARQCPPQDVLLRRPLPIFIRYATCTAENGRLRFYQDIYGQDQALREALYCP